MEESRFKIVTHSNYWVNNLKYWRGRGWNILDPGYLGRFGKVENLVYGDIKNVRYYDYEI